jgi:hypothetical protein
VYGPIFRAKLKRWLYTLPGPVLGAATILAWREMLRAVISFLLEPKIFGVYLSEWIAFLSWGN